MSLPEVYQNICVAPHGLFGSYPAGVAAYLSQSTFSSLFPLINPSTGSSACTGKGFFTYDSLVTAANKFPSFLHNGDATKDKRELAAFLGQASQETNGAAGGQYNGGLCFVEEGGATPTTLSYCTSTTQHPCNAAVSYHGRGPLQISYNFNYEPAGAAVGFDGLNNPMAVSSNAVTSWEASLWFWTTAAGGKPSSHFWGMGAISNRHCSRTRLWYLWDGHQHCKWWCAGLWQWSGAQVCCRGSEDWVL